MRSAPPATEEDPRAPGALTQDTDEMPQVAMTRRRMFLAGLFVVSALAFLYFVLPKLADLRDTWGRLDEGDPWWLGVAFVAEALSFVGYIWWFRTVFVRGERSRIDWRASYQITMAGVVATRLFAAAGAGGIALTAWAVRRSGMEPRVVACRMIAFLGLIYTIFMLALVVFGIGLRVGIFSGPDPFGFTVVPAIFGATALAVGALISLLPHDVERRLEHWAHGSGRAAHVIAAAVTVPASAASGLRTAGRILRDREPGSLGAVMWWAFDIATLWACFNAFGDSPTLAVLVLGYYVGQIANTLPLPGGIGAVEGGMIGTYIAFGVNSGLAVVAVLSYRIFSFWLPTIPGGVAYWQLRKTVARWRQKDAVAA
jgi:uncharacterized membrane protein YbhN (UPF0104 family)